MTIRQQRDGFDNDLKHRLWGGKKKLQKFFQNGNHGKIIKNSHKLFLFNIRN